MQFNIGIDMGGSSVRMAAQRRGVVYRQSSALAIDARQAAPLAIGNESLHYIGRTPGSISVVRPMRAGMITRDEWVTEWFKYLFETATSAGLVPRVRALLAVDGDVQPSAVSHLKALALDSGATSCSVMRADFAAALGAGLRIDKPEASFVLDIGASRISATVISCGRLVKYESLPYGMERINEHLSRILRLRHGLIVGSETIEEMKLQLCSAISGREEPPFHIVGFKPSTGFPVQATITAEEVFDAATLIVESICELAASAIEDIPIELAADLNDAGVSLTGGGAQLFGLHKLVAEKTGLPCRVMDDPSNCTVHGLARVIDAPDAYDAMIDAPVRRIERRLNVSGRAGS